MVGIGRQWSIGVTYTAHVAVTYRYYSYRYQKASCMLIDGRPSRGTARVLPM